MSKIISIVYGIEYGITFVLSVLSVLFLRQQRKNRGCLAARKSVLPSFEPMLWIYCGISGIFTLYFIITLLMGYTGPGPGRYQQVYNEVFYQGSHFHLVFVGIFIYQKSVSVPAIMRSLIIALIVLGMPVACMGMLYILGRSMNRIQIHDAQLSIACCSRALLSLFFLSLLISPTSRANTRALRELSCFALVFYALGIAYTGIYYNWAILDETDTRLEAWGIYVFIASSIWISLTPVIIWRILKADTEYWRGVGARVCCCNQECRDHHVTEVVSAEGFHVLVEMHRHHLIDFADLEWRGRLGYGGSASVYRGLLNASTNVAIKMYAPHEITEDIVLEFSKEAALWSILDHPNITSFYGLCVCPPTICLVSELCRGNLFDLLNTTPKLSLIVQLCCMIDAARAVAYLHSFSPPLLHRDIKAANFLVDAYNNVKLSDFGESRIAAISFEKAMSVRGTFEYMAPEMLDGKQGHAKYDTSSDIYSLAITFWDILHPGAIKYEEGDKNHMHIFELVINGSRPIIQASTPPALRDLIEISWQTDSLQRPSAANIIQRLELLLEEASGPILQKLQAFRQPSSGTTTWTGVALAEMLLSFKDVANDRHEAVRIGNALMDMGFLHHTKHSNPFRISMDHQYTINQRLRRRSSFPFLRESDTEPITCMCKQKGQGFHTKVQLPSVFGRTRRIKKRVKSELSIELLSDTNDQQLWHEWNLRDTAAISI
ncbi:kinase [Thraustotheca clavata]|uniref:Kinase n=1 Tax=Thraustotheca clavata TaxID=74557 RepID=A0A1V9ZVZ2_9STRA|nr:kinase [Thraustotheca clavata]